MLYFYPRSPQGERQPCRTKHSTNSKFLSTLSARRATGRVMVIVSVLSISIHALRKESDVFLQSPPPRRKAFLSTLSARRATFIRIKSALTQNNFYPRSPQGERLDNRKKQRAPETISIHALRKESDSVLWMVPNRLSRFLSTLSARRATERPGQNCQS